MKMPQIIFVLSISQDGEIRYIELPLLIFFQAFPQLWENIAFDVLKYDIAVEVSLDERGSIC